MASKMKVRAIKLEQGGPVKKDGKMYIATIKARDLIDTNKFTVDVWDPTQKGGLEDEQGYQRHVDKNRAREISKYLRETPNASFPSALTLSSRHNLAFDSTDGVHGMLTIGEHINEFPIYIIDGQHRIAGLRHAIEEHDADLGNMDIACTLLANYDKIEEVRQFFDLNTLQKKVSTDLAQQLMRDLVKQDPARHSMYKEAKQLWKVQALGIVDALNEESGSAWKDKIKVPHKVEDEKTRKSVVGQTSMVTSLRPLLTAATMSADTAREVVSNYWKAIQNVFPGAFVNPKDYVIQKTPGVFAFHMILPSLVIKLGVDNTSVKNFEEMLKTIPDHDEDITVDFWRSDTKYGASQYGSMKGFRLLADRFEDALTEAKVL